MEDSGVSDVLGLGRTGVKALELGARFLDRLLGPAVDQYGDILAEKVRKRRERVLTVAATANDYVGDLPIHHIPDRTLVPLLNGAVNEDDESLQAKWAGLLANCATAPNGIPPAFPRILADLSPIDAQILDTLYDRSPYSGAGATPGTMTLDTLSGGIDVNMDDTLLHLANLERHGLISTSDRVSQVDSAGLDPRLFHILIASFGAAFVRACRPPRKAGSALA